MILIGAHWSPVNYATARLDAASGAMAAYLAGYARYPPSPSPFISPYLHRVPRGQADEPVARSHPVSCRFRPYAVRVLSRRARARIQVCVCAYRSKKRGGKRAPRVLEKKGAPQVAVRYDRDRRELFLGSSSRIAR